MMADNLERFVGPRVPSDEMSAHRTRYVIPTLLFAAAAVLFVVSIFLPYWNLTLNAPQYPKGLTIVAYLNHLDGDVSEIDGLNHYIGMRPLDEAAQVREVNFHYWRDCSGAADPGRSLRPHEVGTALGASSPTLSGDISDRLTGVDGQFRQQSGSDRPTVQ